MMKNKGIIDALNTSQKLNLLTCISSKKNNKNISLTKEEMWEICKNIDLTSIFSKTKNQLTFEVFKVFIEKLYSVVVEQKNQSKSFEVDIFFCDKPKKSKEFFYSKSTILSTSSKNELILFIESELEEEKMYREKLESQKFTIEEFNNIISKKKIITKNLIDKKVDKLIDIFMPYIERLLNSSTTKPVASNTVPDKKVVNKKVDSNLTTKLFTNKTKRIIIILIAIYYNAAMFLVYKHQISELNKNNILPLFWIFINVLFFVLFVRNVQLTRKNKENPYVKMLEDFKVYEYEEIIITKKNNFSNSVDLQKNCIDFSSFLATKGLYLEMKQIREVFSSLASSRLLFVNSQYCEEFLCALNEFLGNQTFVDTLSSPANLIWKHEAGTTCSTDFINGICEASKRSNNINIISLLNVNLDDAVNYLNVVMNYITNPEEKGVIKIDGAENAPIYPYLTNNMLPIPKNVWFLLFTNEAKLPRKLVNEGILLKLYVKKIEVKNQ